MAYMPTQEQLQKVIDNLNKAVLIANGQCPVDMNETLVAGTHPCGTPMCHGGWYAVVDINYNNCDGYREGATKMAHDLGFEHAGYLERWADSNPIIWGNADGSLMFCSIYAFSSSFSSDDGSYPDDPAITLQDIVKHWEGVKERAAVA